MKNKKLERTIGLVLLGSAFAFMSVNGVQGSGAPQATGEGGVIWGSRTKATAEDATAFGKKTSATKSKATAFGYSTKAEGNYATAFGSYTKATDAAATAFGVLTTASNQNATAFGKSTTASGENATAFGSQTTASGNNATAFGEGSEAKGQDSLAALGGHTDGSASHSFAIGMGAKADLANSFALGDGAIANRASGTAGYLAGEKTDAAWVATKNALAIGAEAKEGTDNATVTRQIIGVAAGTRGTDAVNVAQLQAWKPTFYSGGTNKGTYAQGTQIEGLTNLADLKIDFGEGLKAEKKGDSTLFVSLDKEFIKNDPDLKGGTGKITGGTNISVTPETEGAEEYTVSLKDTIALTKDGSVTVGDTTVATDGISVKDGPSLKQDGIDGGNKKITKVANGTVAKGSFDAVNGGQLFDVDTKVENNTKSIADNTKNIADNAKNISNNTKSIADNTKNIGNNTKSITDNTKNIADNAKNIGDNTKNIADNAMGINSLGARINDVGAGAAALAALHPLDYDPEYKWDFAAAYGHYSDSDSFAVGAFYRPNSQYMVSAGAVIGNSDDMYNIGLSAKIGRGSAESVGSSRMALLHEMRDLKAKNEKQDEKISIMERENETLRKQVQLLLQKVNDWEQGHSGI